MKKVFFISFLVLLLAAFVVKSTVSLPVPHLKEQTKKDDQKHTSKPQLNTLASDLHLQHVDIQLKQWYVFQEFPAFGYSLIVLERKHFYLNNFFKNFYYKRLLHYFIAPQAP